MFALRSFRQASRAGLFGALARAKVLDEKQVDRMTYRDEFQAWVETTLYEAELARPSTWRSPLCSS